MPGYGLTLGYTLTYLSLIVLIPLAGLLLRPVTLGWHGFWQVVLAPRVLAALELSFGASLIAAAINATFGGWDKAQKTHFADGGVFDQIYHPGN